MRKEDINKYAKLGNKLLVAVGTRAILTKIIDPNSIPKGVTKIAVKIAIIGISGAITAAAVEYNDGLIDGIFRMSDKLKGVIDDAA